MRFKTVKSEKLQVKSGASRCRLLFAVYLLPFTFYFLLFSCLLLFAPCPVLHAGMQDRVVAFVDNTAITLSELEMKYAETLKAAPNSTTMEVLTTMVNRTLLLREARRFRLEAPSEDGLLKEYIDLKIRAFIRIRDQEITDFYQQHLVDFQGKELDEVREQIEAYLIENELNQRLKSHIDELRGKACVKVQFDR
jgi:hypothetical protein